MPYTVCVCICMCMRLYVYVYVSAVAAVVAQYQLPFLSVLHLAPRGAKNEQAFSGVILKSERPSGPLFTRSGPPFFTFQHKIEALSPLMPSFAHSGPHVMTFCH